jgi:peptidoglycan DL-endopeptidase CwlO
MLKVGIIVAVAGVLVFVLVLVTGTVGSVVIGGEQQAADAAFQNSSCDASLGPGNIDGGADGATQAGQLNPGQQQIVAMIISIGKQQNLPALAWQVAIQAGMQESHLTNVDHGDLAGPDSRGIFQMRPSQGWGTEEQVTDPTYEITKFYQVLTKVPGWQQNRPGADAQYVENSAFPLAYDKWEAMAAALVQNVGQVTDPSGCTAQLAGDVIPNASPQAQKAIAFALSQIGKPYVWGATGPDAFDCSGLMLRAYQAAGITLPRVSWDQYTAGAHLPVHDAQPGDLMFLATDPSNPATIHHVFMYLGNNQMVEAPYTGHPVRQMAMPWNDRELVPEAVRPGV